MRVAIFTDTYLPDVNGVAKTLGRWVSYLEKHHIPCKVFTPNQSLSNIREESFVERFSSVPLAIYPECRLTVAYPPLINQAIKQFSPTIIHVATPFNMGLYGKWYATKNEIPWVTSYHTHFDQYLAYYRIKWMEFSYWRYMKWFHTGCEKIFVPSKSTQTYLNAKGFTDLEIWSRGIDNSTFNPIVDRSSVLAELGIDEKKFVILYVGRLAPEKDIDVLLEAYRNLPDSVKVNSHLVLAGDGPLYKEYTQAAHFMEHQNISYLGFVQGKKLQQLYAASDLFVFPSPTETFGNVVLEAMSSGTPVIAANRGGVIDSIVHGKTGWLCEAGNHESFADAMVKLYEQEELRKKLTSEALAYCKTQSWDVIFHSLLKQYEQVIEKSEPIKVSTF